MTVVDITIQDETAAAVPQPRLPAPAVWSADSVVIREGTIFSFGWCGKPGAKVVKSWVEANYQDGSAETFAVQYGIERADVPLHFPALSNNCGYFVFFAFRDSAAVGAISIFFEFDDGNTAKYLLPMAEALQADPFASGWRDQVAALGRDAKRALAMLMRGQSGAVLDAFNRRKTLLGAKRGDVDALDNAIKQMRPNSVFLIDHALGGGANKFSDGLIQRYLQNKRDVVVWTFMPSLLRFQVSFWRALDGIEKKYHVTWDAHVQILASEKVTDLVFNNSVSFTKPHRVPELLASAKNICSAHVTVYVHDYNVVCPSHFLLDAKGGFCGIPSPEVCRRCLPSINDGFVSLHTSRDIDRWRSLWGAALLRADQIICFSNSTAELLRRAYPALTGDNLSVQPHKVVAPPGKFVRSAKPSRVKVAVVGHISEHKGAGVVAGLAAAARDMGAQLDVVVIGTLMGAAGVGACEQTGSYEQAKLAALLREHNVNVALMPSICPETFSYVTHELIHLEIPLMCFDLGAQAEAVRQYQLGRVVPFTTGRQLVGLLQDFALESAAQ